MKRQEEKNRCVNEAAGERESERLVGKREGGGRKSCGQTEGLARPRRRDWGKRAESMCRWQGHGTPASASFAQESGPWVEPAQWSPPVPHLPCPLSSQGRHLSLVSSAEG